MPIDLSNVNLGALIAVSTVTVALLVVFICIFRTFHLPCLRRSHTVTTDKLSTRQHPVVPIISPEFQPTLNYLKVQLPVAKDQGIPLDGSAASIAPEIILGTSENFQNTYSSINDLEHNKWKLIPNYFINVAAIQPANLIKFLNTAPLWDKVSLSNTQLSLSTIRNLSYCQIPPDCMYSDSGYLPLVGPVKVQESTPINNNETTTNSSSTQPVVNTESMHPEIGSAVDDTKLMERSFDQSATVKNEQHNQPRRQSLPANFKSPLVNSRRVRMIDYVMYRHRRHSNAAYLNGSLFPIGDDSGNSSTVFQDKAVSIVELPEGVDQSPFFSRKNRSELYGGDDPSV